MSEGASDERRILWLERKLSELMDEVRALKARTRAAEEQAAQLWIGAAGQAASLSPLQYLVCVTTSSLASGTYASPSTCTGTRSDTSATVTITNNALTFSTAYPSGSGVICLTDGVTIWAISGSC